MSATFRIRRPYALITSASGGTLLLGPLDNHSISKTLPLSHALPWKAEAQDQAPPLEPGWTGKVIFIEGEREWPTLDIDGLTGLEPNKVHRIF
jgi:hypothetical protein